MGLRIVNNIAAMNAHRWLTGSDAGLSKSLERLSSGYRINRAADDAAGLAISQGFRANIAGFRVASRNTSEASALLQVAEGGMDQIGNILTRLKELATQASSANVGSSERVKINAEASALVAEVDRIANATKYGSTNLIDGTFGAVNSASAMTGGADDVRVYGDLTHVYSMTDGTSGGLLNADLAVTGLESTLAASATWVFTATGTSLALGNGATTETITGALDANGNSVDFDHTAAETFTFANLGVTFTVDSGLTTAQWDAGEIDFRDTGLTNLNVNNAQTGTYVFTSSGTSLTIGNGTVTQTISDFNPGTAKSFNFDALGITLTLGTDYTDNDLDNVSFTVAAVTGGAGATFQIGAENDSNNQISLSIDGVRTADLSISTIDLSTAANAQAAIDSIDAAVSTLASSRGDVGAYMNRLGYAASNLASIIENVQAAESIIRDVDMASEMTTFTKNQILLQAGTAMLAQANMAPQMVLQLFG